MFGHGLLANVELSGDLLRTFYISPTPRTCPTFSIEIRDKPPAIGVPNQQQTNRRENSRHRYEDRLPRRQRSLQEHDWHDHPDLHCHDHWHYRKQSRTKPNQPNHESEESYLQQGGKSEWIGQGRKRLVGQSDSPPEEHADRETNPQLKLIDCGRHPHLRQIARSIHGQEEFIGQRLATPRTRRPIPSWPP